MSNEVLLKTLQDTLHRIERKKEEAEDRVKAYKEMQQGKRERLHNAEQRQHQAEEQHKKVTQEMEVLKTFMSSEEGQSCALVEQFDLLHQGQLGNLSAVKSATDHAHLARAACQLVTGQLMMAEQDRVAAQREWDEIAEKVTHISGSSLQ